MFDILSFVINAAYFGIRINQKKLVSLLDNDDDISNKELMAVILQAFVITSIFVKISFFSKVNETMGLMSALLFGVFNAVIPFLIIFLFWIIFLH